MQGLQNFFLDRQDSKKFYLSNAYARTVRLEELTGRIN